ncbi:hypothetical protein FNF28_01796 [Cafeteria roenbergensis]|uniref:Uncharacterized protein n=1 Tax=Cafeteria roenbergensis TaxID=33653 RepID=A0A5A8DXB9_CAFRO|nr:hypothetical protein FNF28_01796 [Cafeteria roenbergensis]
MEARVRGRSWQGSAADRAGRTVGDREGTLDPRSERRRSPVLLTSRPLLSTPALAANASLGEYSQQASSSFVMPSSPPPYCRVVWAPVQVSVVSGSLGADIDRLD